MHTRIHGVVALGALAFAAPALANGTQTVTCGQTLTRSVKLAADLTNCPGNGLVAGADGITIDLNGHTLDGTGNAMTCDRPERPRTGVDVSGHDGVTVTNGTVQQFATGVSAGSARNGRVHDLTLRENPLGGVVLASAPGAPATAGNRVDHTVVSGAVCDAGLKVNTGRGNRLDDNRVEQSLNGITICCGAATDGNVVEDNTIIAATEAGVLVSGSGGGRVSGNSITGGEIGVHLNDGATDTVVRGNTVTEAGDGIWLVDSDGDVVARNTVLRAGGPAGFGSGVLLNGASDARIVANTISGGAGFAPGIVVGLPDFFGPSPRPVARNLLAGNTVSAQQADGIHVFPVAQGTTLRRNTAVHNSGDGVNVESPSTTITRTVADDNVAFGIEAVPGVADGGRNEAHGNGAGQCAGVICAG